jgi:hypothetical protein
VWLGDCERRWWELLSCAEVHRSYLARQRWGGAAGAGAELVHRRFGVASVLEDLVRDVEALWFCRGPPHHITLSV